MTAKEAFQLAAQLAQSLRRIRMLGSDRVVVDESGYATSTLRANELGVPCDIYFIRDDGWILSTSAEFESVAFSLWKDCWIGFVRVGPDILQPLCAKPIAEYSP